MLIRVKETIAMRRTRLVLGILLSITILFCARPIIPVKGENALPTASFTYSPDYPQPSEPVTFNASQSYDPDGYIIVYQWDFGDGNTANIPNYPFVQHTYSDDGTYLVGLQVVDNNGGRGATGLTLIVSTETWFRVVDSSGKPISNVTVTIYYATSYQSTSWQVAPAAHNGVEIKYDYLTQPNKAKTDAQKYRNPGTTASIMYPRDKNSSNIGFDLHPSGWYGFFKFQWGSNVFYWPNETSRVFNYDGNHGTVETHYYNPNHGAIWNSAAGTYVIKVGDIPSAGVGPCENHPILVYCPVIPALAVSISPASATMDVGQSKTFTSTVLGGSSPYTYQWYLNNAPISGATNPTWTFTPTSSGSYTVYLNVTDSTSKRVKSNIASVTVNAALSVTISPGSVTLDVGQSQLFTSTVSGGTGPYSYQWYLDGVAVSGATSSSWTYTPSASGSHTVYVKVTDAVSAVATSNTATVTVNGAFSVTISPTSVVMDVGQSKLFTSTVSGGTSPFAYQWYLNGIAVLGATSATWTFTPTSAGSYTVYVKVTDSATTPTSALSNTAHVTVYPQLAVTISPLTSTIYLGQSQTYTSDVDSTGTSPYSYQWYLNGSLVSGATNAAWTFTPTANGTYQIYVKVTDGVNEVAQSSNAQLTVNQKPQMGVTINPSSVVIDMSQSVPFTSSVEGGTAPFTYQWYLNGSAVSGATSSTWTFTPTSTGYYQVYLNVTDSLSVKAKSNTASVTVNSLPSVSISPSSVVMDVGQSQLFTSTVSGGTGPYSYQWYLDGSPVSGATSSAWTYTPASAGSHTVYVKVADSVSATATSNNATVTVNGALSVSILPTSVTLDVGQSQTFTSTVTGGTSPFSYQWYLDGSPVSGATGSTWTYIPSVSGSHTVYVRVTDSASTPVTAQSNTANVTVNGLPTVSITPTSATIHVGDTINFNSAVLGGTSPYSYQWYLNGSAVSGATLPTWIFSQPAGSYTVYLNITDHLGAKAQSNVAPVTVIKVFTVTISPPSASITIGNSVPFTSTVNGGVTPYYYQWYLNGAPVPLATNPAWTFTPTSTGTYDVYLSVTDSMAVTVKSNVAPVTVTVFPHGVGGRSTSVSAFNFLAPWLGIISLLAAAVLLKGTIVKKKRR